MDQKMNSSTYDDWQTCESIKDASGQTQAYCRNRIFGACCRDTCVSTSNKYESNIEKNTLPAPESGWYPQCALRCNRTLWQEYCDRQDKKNKTNLSKICYDTQYFQGEGVGPCAFNGTCKPYEGEHIDQRFPAKCEVDCSCRSDNCGGHM